MKQSRRSSRFIKGGVVKTSKWLRPRVAFVPEDIWIGLYIDRERQTLPSILTTMQRYYVCLIPTIAIVLTRRRDYY